MTSMCGLCTLTRKHGKMIQVERQDGKTLELKGPMLVEEVLERNPGAAAVVALSNDDDHCHLPLKYRLKSGKMYYLVPKASEESEARVVKEDWGRKRIKVVITKQQLEQLVSNQISIQDVMMAHNRASWSQELESIPEEEDDEYCPC